MKPHIFAVALLLAITGCQGGNSDNRSGPASGDSSQSANDAFRFVDVTDSTTRPSSPAYLAIEVALDRAGFSSGVLDGKETRFDALALRGFQEAKGLAATGVMDAPTKAALARSQPGGATRLVRIPAAFGQQRFMPDLPQDSAKQAAYDHLGYRNIMEALAERFHTTPELLVALNRPDTKVGAGAVIRVPNIPDVDSASLSENVRGWNQTLIALGVSPDQPAAAKVVVDKSDKALRAYDAEGKLIAQFPATMGSRHDPLPIGSWKIQGVSKNPEFHYNPKLFWDVSDAKREHLLQPGPNGPVGVVWLDLSKPHYGIHGTSEPASIGISQSHGCVRLTNWDAARLAQMVKAGVPAVFQP